jgi:hypothetical protein
MASGKMDMARETLEWTVGTLSASLAAGPPGPALMGTFITHSCAVPTDCGKPIWLQEALSRGHSSPDPTLSLTS